MTVFNMTVEADIQYYAIFAYLSASKSTMITVY